MNIIPYTLSTDPVHTLDLPASATILSAALRANRITVWVLVPNHHFYGPRYLHVVGTNTPIDPEVVVGRRFLGTVQMETGMVYHVFEQRPGFTL